MTTKITSANLDPATIPDPQKAEFNTSLLGFKMAVNEGLTVFNLVDGVVDEFHVLTKEKVLTIYIVLHATFIRTKHHQ